MGATGEEGCGAAGADKDDYLMAQACRSRGLGSIGSIMSQPQALPFASSHAGPVLRRSARCQSTIKKVCSRTAGADQDGGLASPRLRGIGPMPAWINHVGMGHPRVCGEEAHCFDIASSAVSRCFDITSSAGPRVGGEHVDLTSSRHHPPRAALSDFGFAVCFEKGAVRLWD